MSALALKALAALRGVGRALTPTAWLTIAILAAFLIFGGYCAQRAVQGEKDRQAVQTAKIERKGSTGRETASGERLNDQASINQQRKATDDALSPLPDAVPSARRVTRHCLRMQRDGVDTSRFPECRRPDGQTPAGR